MVYSETKTDDLDKIELDGYDFKMKNRGTFLDRKSGSLVLGCKKELASKIKVFSTASNLCFGLKYAVSGDIFNLDEDVIFGIVYVPTENARYSSNTAFAEIEAEYLVFLSNYKYISHLVDFNGRTSNDDDFILIDKHRQFC